MQNVRAMDARGTTVRILLIRRWTESVAPIREALDAAGVAARITRVDIEPALNAALCRTEFDVVIFDPATENLSVEVIEARLREHRRISPIVTLNAAKPLAEALQHALRVLMN